MQVFTTGARTTEGIGAVVMSIVGVAIAVSGSQWSVWMLGAGLALLGAALAWLYLRQKVVVADGTVTVVNFWRTHRIPINSIKSIEVRFLPLDGVGAAYLNLEDGGGVYASGISLGKVQGTGTWKRGAAEVRRLAKAIVGPSHNSGQDENDPPLLVQTSPAEDSSTPWYVWLVPVVGLAIALALISTDLPYGGILAFIGVAGAGLMTSLSRRRP